MAERRMFAKTIIDSDAFLDMPISARLLYYDLSMRADDDGFVNSPKKIMRMIGASIDDMNILITRKFVIAFDNGVVVIKHWRIHNYIRKDTYNETPYLEQKALLELDEKNAYTLKNNQRSLPVDEPSTQVSIGKDSIDKDNIYGQKIDQQSKTKIENLDNWKTKFEKFYKEYPKKVKKQDVEKWFNKNKPSDELFNVIMESLKKFKICDEWKKDKGKFIPHPTSWLNQKRWEDELKEPEQEETAIDRFEREMEEKERNGDAI